MSMEMVVLEGLGVWECGYVNLRMGTGVWE